MLVHTSGRSKWIIKLGVEMERLGFLLENYLTIHIVPLVASRKDLQIKGSYMAFLVVMASGLPVISELRFDG